MKRDTNGTDHAILLFQRVVPAYRVPIFKALSQNFGVIVCHSIERPKATWKSFHDNMDYRNILLPRLYFGRSDTNMVQNIFPVLLKFKPAIIISEFAIGYLSFWLLYVLKPFFGYKLAVWTHGVGNREMLHPFSNIRSKVELAVLRSVDAVLLYSYQRQRMIIKRLGDNSRIFVAPNTLDTENLDRIYKEMTRIGKVEIKKNLGYTNRYNLIYVGRLLGNKRIELLLEAFELLSPRFDVGLHIIGDGPEKALVEEYKKRIPSIHTYGAVFEEERLARHIFGADLIVNPGYVGLSIVHAFAYGTPMVTCRTTEQGPFHSPEVEYLRHGENGLFCDSFPASLADEITGLLNDPDRLQKMSSAATETVQRDCSLGNMLGGFEQLVTYLRK
jgi:glycosyltransferase involved in cell wall biosynthesis